MLIDFQILNREKYLRNFLLVFKKVDLDNNGVINDDEFIKIINLTKKYQTSYDFNSNVIKLLRLVDPFYHKQITFSDCVKHLSKVYNFYNFFNFIILGDYLRK